MEIRNSFDVPLQPDDAWKVLMDVPRIVPCMPGAELIDTIDERSYRGKVSVKLGPVALAFTGNATFEEIDDVAKTARLKAQGADTKGRGRAEAAVRFHLEPIPEGSRVNVVTDVVLSGSVAQYGRGAGLIQSVASQLIGQFADCLRTMLAQENIVSPAGSPSNEAPASMPAASQTRIQQKPISGFSLILSAIWASIRGLFSSKS